MKRVVLAVVWSCVLAWVGQAASGEADPTFAVWPGVGLAPSSVHLLSDGRILLSQWGRFGGREGPYVVRLNADGTLDPSFDATAAPLTSLFSIKPGADGRVLVAGTFTNDLFTNGLGRLRADGSMDWAFVPRLPFPDPVREYASLPDGKVIVGGTDSESQLQTLARLNDDGALDSSFRPGLQLTLSADVIVPLPDGKLLLGGQFTEVNGEPRFGVARLNPDGTLDSSFVPARTTHPRSQLPLIDALAVQPDGKVLVGGQFTSVAGIRRSGIVRLNADGTLDPSFDAGPMGTLEAPTASAPIHFIGVEQDGHLLVSGEFGVIQGAPRRNLVRLESDGRLDHSFLFAVPKEGGILRAALGEDGTLLVTASGNPLLRVIRAPPAPDPPALVTQSRTQTRTNGQAFCLTVEVRSPEPPAHQWYFNGRALPGTTNAWVHVRNAQFAHMGTYELVVSNRFGTATSAPIHMVICPPHANAGAVDLSFDAGRGPDSPVVCIQPVNDQILIGGNFTKVDGVQRVRIARLNADGTLDRTFDPGHGPNGTVGCLLPLPDGRLLAGGGFGYVQHIRRSGLARLNPDGSLDQSSGELVVLEAGVSLNVTALVRQNDGRILVAGTCLDALTPFLARLEPDGTRPRLLSTHLPSHGHVATVAPLAGQRLLVAGLFRDDAGRGGFGLVRLHPDGSVDPPFQIAPWLCQSNTAPNVDGLHVLRDGRILAAGDFPPNETNRTPIPRLIRLLPNGRYDADYRPDAARSRPLLFGLSGSQFATLPDGQLLLATAGHVVRLKPDGVADSELTRVGGGIVHALAVQPDGDLLVGGSFTTIAGMPRVHIGRVYGSDREPIPDLIGPFLSEHGFQIVLATYAGRTYTLEASEDVAETAWTRLAATVGDGTYQAFVDPDQAAPRRFYRLKVSPQSP